MGSRAGPIPWVVAWLLLTAPHLARADETPLIVGGADFETASGTVAPIVVLRLPFGEADRLTLSQLGWSSGVGLEIAEAKGWAWQSSVVVVPLRAHLSQSVYDPDGNELKGSEFLDTEVRAATGQLWTWRHARVFAQAVLGKDWLFYAPSTLEQDFQSPFGGAESGLTVEFLRAEDPLDARVDGVRALLHGEALYGGKAWADTDLALSAGRRVGPLFFRLDTDTFLSSLDTPLTDFIIGGSWDVLAGTGLYGHPLGAYRLSRGAAGTAGVDVQVVGPVEVGLRGSLLLGTPTPHEGLALLVLGRLWGVHFFFGAGVPDGSLWGGDLSKTSIFGGIDAALFLPP